MRREEEKTKERINKNGMFTIHYFGQNWTVTLSACVCAYVVYLRGILFLRICTKYSPFPQSFHSCTAHKMFPIYFLILSTIPLASCCGYFHVYSYFSCERLISIKACGLNIDVDVDVDPIGESINSLLMFQCYLWSQYGGYMYTIPFCDQIIMTG